MRTAHKTKHDHKACVRAALNAARRRCGVKLTPLRRRVLELVWSSHRPIGAYGILARLASERGGASPPTVYRALEFLTQNGLAHKIAHASAYVGCTHPDSGPHAGQFLLCGGCGEAVELEGAGIARAISQEARRKGFSVEHPSLEISGRCTDCARESRAQ